MRKFVLALTFAAVACAADWKLGTTEMTGLIGANASEGYRAAHWTIGTGGALGLTRYLAVQGDYTYGRSYAEDVDRIEVRAATHTLLAGPRIMVPVPGRVTPFVDGYVGSIRQNVGASGYGVNVGVGYWKLAYGAGAGAEVRFSKNGSFSVSARGIRAHQDSWHGAVLFGVHYRITAWRDAKWRM